MKFKKNQHSLLQVFALVGIYCKNRAGFLYGSKQQCAVLVSFPLKK
jgi:hypothetical protein